MSEKNAIARPYAKAAFEYALEHKQLPKWSEMLHTAALVVSDAGFAALLKSPTVTTQQCEDLLLSICGKQLSEGENNFLRLLAEQRRLTVLPEIANLFTAYRADYEKTVTVQVTSVFALSQAIQDKLQQALRIRLQRDVSLNCVIDKSLLGGAVIRAGDLVIDGSLRGRLIKLEQTLKG